LHDIDANKPGGSIKIRVKTFAYTLEQYKQTLQVNEPKKVVVSKEKVSQKEGASV
jgi:predicted nucleotide-binding protein (sugar kinase/HSP70/actin superfamily)